MAAQEGTELHDLAAMLIRKKIKLKATQQTMNMFVNDAIGYRMIPEQVLKYSDYFYGTADAIGLKEGRGKPLLRIFDLKTGLTATSVHQLEVYAALFCLEYDFRPFELDYDLRIYQADDVQEFETDPEEIARIMSKGIGFTKLIEQWLEEAVA